MIRLYAAAVAAFLLFAAGAWIGHGMTAASYRKDIIAEQERTAQAVAAAAAEANQHAEELEKARAHREVVYRTITKEVDKLVERPVYRNVCLDDDGLQRINEALTGAPAVASQPDPAVSASHASGRQNGR